jgi:tRNA threonylcarbamoyladenosine biosynthesis protein TsaB
LNILAIDTAHALLSAAVSGPGGIRYGESPLSEGSHSENLMPLIDSLITEAGLQREDLELVACMEGPGSFTGLRIGFAAAKGLSLALNIPLLPIPTLDCLAYPHSAWPGLVIPALDAKKKRFYTAIYRGEKRLTEYLDAEPDEIAGLLVGLRPAGAPALITGPDAPLLFEALGGAQLPVSRSAAGETPREILILDPAHLRGAARELLEISQKKTIIVNKSTLEPELFAKDNAGPVYLRKSDAELNLL